MIFLTLEDETGIANIVVWAKIFERFRRAVIAGRCLKVTGRVQRDGDVVHVVAERIEDISALLDEIVRSTGFAPAAAAAPTRAAAGARGGQAGAARPLPGPVPRARG